MMLPCGSITDKRGTVNDGPQERISMPSRAMTVERTMVTGPLRCTYAHPALPV